SHEHIRICGQVFLLTAEPLLRLYIRSEEN
ncbi:MAG: hypothetical protein ACI8YQ_004970, partial [Polaribacter sp.]